MSPSVFDKPAADRLADEVASLIARGFLDTRSAVADALLDYRQPPRSQRSDRIAALEAEIAELRARSDPDALRLWKEDMMAAANVRCASLEAALHAIVPKLIDALRNAADVDASDVYEVLAVAGVIQHVIYDPSQHGEIEDAESGSEVWIFTDFGDQFAEAKGGE